MKYRLLILKGKGITYNQDKNRKDFSEHFIHLLRANLIKESYLKGKN